MLSPFEFIHRDNNDNLLGWSIEGIHARVATRIRLMIVVPRSARIARLTLSGREIDYGTSLDAL